MKTKNMISEGLTVNQLEERLEMASNGILVCCSDEVVSCGVGTRVYVNCK